jgi:hypothetical protein
MNVQQIILCIQASSREIGLSPPGFGNCRARCSAHCHVPCSSPPLRSGSSCVCSASTRYLILSATCRWPAACPMMLPPLALWRITAVDPAGSGPAACRPSSGPHGRPHGGGGGRCTPVRSFLPPECSATTKAKTQTKEYAAAGDQHPNKAGHPFAVGVSARRYKSTGTVVP